MVCQDGDLGQIPGAGMANMMAPFIFRRCGHRPIGQLISGNDPLRIGRVFDADVLREGTVRPGGRLQVAAAIEAHGDHPGIGQQRGQKRRGDLFHRPALHVAGGIKGAVKEGIEIPLGIMGRGQSGRINFLKFRLGEQ